MKQSKIKLFCIPGGGASAYVYWKYMKHLSRNIKLCLLELPGRGGRKKESALTEIRGVVDDLYEHLTKELAKDPGCDYMLLGYCYGGILAYELYKKIQSMGIREPFHVFMSATDAADGTVYSKSLFELEAARGEVQDLLTTYFPETLFEDQQMVADLSSSYVDCLYAQYRQFGKVGDVSYEELCRMAPEQSGWNHLTPEKQFELEQCLEFANQTVGVIEADLAAVYEYKHQPQEYLPFQCDLTIFSGEDDNMTPLEHVKGWVRFAGHHFHVYSMKGGHRMLLDDYEQCMPVINRAAEEFLASVTDHKEERSGMVAGGAV